MCKIGQLEHLFPLTRAQVSNQPKLQTYPDQRPPGMKPMMPSQQPQQTTNLLSQQLHASASIHMPKQLQQQSTSAASTDTPPNQTNIQTEQPTPAQPVPITSTDQTTKQHETTAETLPPTSGTQSSTSTSLLSATDTATIQPTPAIIAQPNMQIDTQETQSTQPSLAFERFNNVIEYNEHISKQAVNNMEAETESNIPFTSCKLGKHCPVHRHPLQQAQHIDVQPIICADSACNNEIQYMEQMLQCKLCPQSFSYYLCESCTYKYTLRKPTANDQLTQEQVQPAAIRGTINIPSINLQDTRYLFEQTVQATEPNDEHNDNVEQGNTTTEHNEPQQPQQKRARTEAEEHIDRIAWGKSIPEDIINHALNVAVAVNDEDTRKVMEKCEDLSAQNGYDAEEWIQQPPNNEWPTDQGASIAAQLLTAMQPKENNYYAALLIFQSQIQQYIQQRIQTMQEQQKEIKKFQREQRFAQPPPEGSDIPTTRQLQTPLLQTPQQQDVEVILREVLDTTTQKPAFIRQFTATLSRARPLGITSVDIANGQTLRIVSIEKGAITDWKETQPMRSGHTHNLIHRNDHITSVNGVSFFRSGLILDINNPQHKKSIDARVRILERMFHELCAAHELRITIRTQGCVEQQLEANMYIQYLKSNHNELNESLHRNDPTAGIIGQEKPCLQPPQQEQYHPPPTILDHDPLMQVPTAPPYFTYEVLHPPPTGYPKVGRSNLAGGACALMADEGITYENDDTAHIQSSLGLTIKKRTTIATLDGQQQPGHTYESQNITGHMIAMVPHGTQTRPNQRELAEDKAPLASPSRLKTNIATMRYGNTNIKRETIPKIQRDLQTTQLEYNNLSDKERNILHYLTRHNPSPATFIYTIQTQGRVNLTTMFPKCFFWTPIHPRLDLHEVRPKNALSQRLHVQQLARALPQKPGKTYRGYDGAVTIAHWEDHTRKLILASQSKQPPMAPPGDISTLQLLINYVADCCHNAQAHLSFLCYDPYADNDNLVKENELNTIAMHVPPLHNSCTTQWRPINAVPLAVRQHEKHIGDQETDLSLFQYALMPPNQVTFNHAYIDHKQLEIILWHGFKPDSSKNNDISTMKQHTHYHTTPIGDRSSPKGLFLDVTTIHLDNYHSCHESPPLRLIMTCVVTQIQKHGADLWINTEHQVLGENHNDQVHAPADSIYSVHEIQWQQHQDIPIGVPARFTVKSYNLVYARDRQDFFNQTTRTHIAQDEFTPFAEVPSFKDAKYNVSTIEYPTQHTFDIAKRHNN